MSGVAVLIFKSRFVRKRQFVLRHKPWYALLALRRYVVLNLVAQSGGRYLQTTKPRKIPLPNPLLSYRHPFGSLSNYQNPALNPI